MDLVEDVWQALSRSAFEPLDQMGFLALKGKIEGRVRDNIAWELWTKHRDLLIVKEWRRQREEPEWIDLAVLEDDQIRLLIEFKAMHNGCWERFEPFAEGVRRDLRKMQKHKAPHIAVFIAPMILRASPYYEQAKYPSPRSGRDRRVGDLDGLVRERMCLPGYTIESSEHEVCQDERIGVCFHWWIVAPL